MFVWLTVKTESAVYDTLRTGVNPLFWHAAGEAPVPILRHHPIRSLKDIDGELRKKFIF
jgi:hypothetical protein